MPTLPTFDLSNIDLGKLELPSVDLPTAEQVIDFFKDATLVGAGLMSLTAEKVAELQKQLVVSLQAGVETARAAV